MLGYSSVVPEGPFHFRKQVFLLTLRQREFRRYFHVYLWRGGSDGTLKEHDHE